MKDSAVREEISWTLTERRQREVEVWHARADQRRDQDAPGHALSGQGSNDERRPRGMGEDRRHAYLALSTGRFFLGKVA